MTNNYKLYGYRWVVLAAFMFINLTIQMLMDHLRVHYRTRGNVLRGDRPADRPVFDGFYDRIYSAVHPGFMGDRYIRFSAGGQHWRNSHGRVRSGSWFGWNKLYAGPLEHHRDRCRSTIPSQRMDDLQCKWFGIEERATAVGIVTLGNLIGTALVWY